MERNLTTNNYGYFKETVNYPTNSPYSEIFQPTYPYEDEIKERRYQPQTNMYYQNYPKPDTNYKHDKAQTNKTYSGYNFGSSSYYDQYKFNMSLPAISNYAKNKDGYHHNYSTGMFPDSKVAPGFCEDANFSTKAPLMKATNPQISPYMLTNCYGYPTVSYPNQNYCSYAQSCTDEARLLWDDYQTNHRLLSSYVPAPPPAPPQSQANCRLKNNYNPDYYGSSSSYAYHADGLRTREKLLYTMNSHTTSSDNLYNSRPIWPLGLQYQSMPQNMMMNSYDRLNYINDAQNYDYCSQRQNNTGFHPTYGKPTLVNPPLKHIRPTTMNNDYYNSQRYYLCNDPLNSEIQDVYSQQYLRENRHNIPYNPEIETNSRSMPVTNEVMGKEPIYNSSADNIYYNQNNEGSLNLASYSDNSKSMGNKGQNLREFLSSWNDDEDDGIEKIEGNDNQIYIQQANVEVNNNYEVENASIENHLQFNGSFNTRPKIHVGITVDSNVAQNQYINLPDIIIDIEKSKELDHPHVETQNLDNEKVVLLEKIEDPVTDLSQYVNINLVENSIEEFKEFPITEITENPLTAVEEFDLPIENIGNIEENSSICPPTLSIDDKFILPMKNEIIRQNVTCTDAVTTEKINVNGMEIVENTVMCADDIPMKELPTEITLKKMKRHKQRILKPKTLRTKSRALKIIRKPKERKITCFKKSSKKIKHHRSTLIKKTNTSTTIITLEHSKNNDHSLNNPKTLKYLCICLINSENGRNFLKQNYIVEKTKSSEMNQSKLFVPKLSVLCEYALTNFYAEKNILLLNLDELDSNLCFVECDINENLISTQNDAIESDFIELLIDDGDNDEEDDCNISITMDVNSSFSNNNTVDNCNEICLTSDENSRDFSLIHHEEIVPDNLHAFQNKKLLKYLQDKYIQKNNYLKIFIIDKICKKYRKYIFKRRRRQQQENTRKNFLSKIKEKFIKKKKHLKIGSC